MKQTRILMGMPITVEVVDGNGQESAIEKVFDYFKHIDEKFSTYKETSEITAINKGLLPETEWSHEMRLIFAMCEETKKETHGYFDIKTPAGTYDPSGIVKGWAIWQAAELLKGEGSRNFYVEAGGDIQVSGNNARGESWAVGIKNPWNEAENVKVAYIKDKGMATSGTYIRGKHIYNPRRNNEPADDIVSLTVIGPNIYEADRFATAAFAMGKEGISFIGTVDDLEGYAIDKDKNATMTPGFEPYTRPND